MVECGSEETLRGSPPLLSREYDRGYKMLPRLTLHYYCVRTVGACSNTAVLLHGPERGHGRITVGDRLNEVTVD